MSWRHPPCWSSSSWQLCTIIHSTAGHTIKKSGNIENYWIWNYCSISNRHWVVIIFRLRKASLRTWILKYWQLFKHIFKHFISWIHFIWLWSKQRNCKALLFSRNSISYNSRKNFVCNISTQCTRIPSFKFGRN